MDKIIHTYCVHTCSIQKKQTALHWIRTGIALSTLSLFSRLAIYELSLLSSVSHVFLILLLNLISLNRYANIISSALINGYYLFNHIHVFHLTKISIVLNYIYIKRKKDDIIIISNSYSFNLFSFEFFLKSRRKERK